MGKGKCPLTVMQWILLVTGLTSWSGEPHFASLATRATDVPDPVVPRSPRPQNKQHLTPKLVPLVGQFSW